MIFDLIKSTVTFGLDFEKKLESLKCAGVTAQTFEAFDVYAWREQNYVAGINILSDYQGMT